MRRQPVVNPVAGAGQRAVAVAPAGSSQVAIAARSARRGSLENTSTMRLLQAEALLQPPDLELLVPQHQGDHHARLAGPGGAARAVQVGLVVLGRVVVDDHVDVVDVEAPGGDVGGDEAPAARPR